MGSTSSRGGELPAFLAVVVDAAEISEAKRVLNEPMDYAHVMESFDATPWRVRCCRLQEMLLPHARYFLRETKDGRPDVWRSCTLAEYRRAFPNAPSNVGVLEVLAQRREIRWVSRDAAGSVTHHRVVHMRPYILQNGSSSVLFSAVESGVFNVKDLNALSSRIGWVIKSAAPDRSKSNGQMMAFRRVKYGPKVLVDEGACHGHLMHSVVEKSTREGDIMFHVFVCYIVFG